VNIRRAIERDDEPPLLLLLALSATIDFNRNVGAGFMRLGERALELGRITALTRITRALTALGNDGFQAPTRWVRALVGSAACTEADYEVHSAVASWLRDKRSDIDGIRDLIPDPEGLIAPCIERA
jgi:hypothetical protein